MTFFCLFFALGDGIPVWLVGVAMICDTILLGVAMATGVIHGSAA